MPTPVAWFKIHPSTFLPLGCNWGIQDYYCSNWRLFKVKESYLVSEIIIYSRNKNTGSLDQVSKKLIIVFSLPDQGNHCQCCTIIHSRWYLSSFFLIIPQTVLHSWPFVGRSTVSLKLEDKNRLIRLYWFLCCWDPFTKSAEGEMNWYKTNKTPSPFFEGK